MGKHRDKRGNWRMFIVIWQEWNEGATLISHLVMERRAQWLLAPNRKEAARMVRLRNPKQMHHVGVTLAPGE